MVMQQTSNMGPEDARAVLRTAVWEETGTYFVLRLGNDPGASRIRELRLALRVLWRFWKDREALPYDITSNAATIIHFHAEAKRNLGDNSNGVRPEVNRELDDVALGAFELLSGADAEGFVVRRPDLGE